MCVCACVHACIRICVRTNIQTYIHAVKFEAAGDDGVGIGTGILPALKLHKIINLIPVELHGSDTSVSESLTFLLLEP